MALQPYPLEALRKLRDERAEAQARSLASQITRTQSAEARLHERERARREHAERAAESVLQEQQRLLEEGASGAELRRMADFAEAARAQGELLQRAEAEAREVLAKERLEAQKMQREQVAREAEAALVRHHEASFHDRQAALAEQIEEETALEQWNARHR